MGRVAAVLATCWCLWWAAAVVAPSPVAVVEVNRTADDTGGGSLRAAILAANALGNTTAQAVTVIHVVANGTLHVQSPLPLITAAVMLEAHAGFVLDGSQAGGGQQGGLVIGSGALDCRITGLRLRGFAGSGLVLFGSFAVIEDVEVSGCGQNGVLVAGAHVSVARSRVFSNARDGVQVFGPFFRMAASSSFANGVDGVYLQGTSASVVNCTSGTTFAGAAGLGNGADGFAVAGNLTSISGSVASGNTVAGVAFYRGVGCSLANSVVGLDPLAVRRHGNGDGVLVSSSALTTTIGPGNVISGNRRNGVTDLAVLTRVVQNCIGLDGSGQRGLGNGQHGVLTGTFATVASNVISGNADVGVVCFERGATVRDNLIGTNADGTAAVGNLDGVHVPDTVAEVTIGPGNVIAGHANGAGAQLFGRAIRFLENRVGTDAAGKRALPNLDGVQIAGTGNTLAGCLVSGNDDVGVHVSGGGHTVANSTIGLDVDALYALSNFDGIVLAGSGDSVVVGCLISGNDEAGISILSALGGGTVVNNSIGTVAGNRLVGIYIDTRTVGSVVVSNVIAGNVAAAAQGTSITAGMAVLGRDTLVHGNSVGCHPSGSPPLPPNLGAGIAVARFASNTTLSHNHICSSLRAGMALHGAANTATANVLIGNREEGILIGPSANGTAITHNTVSASGAAGVQVDGEDTLVAGNEIGAAPAVLTGPGANYTLARLSGNGGGGIVVGPTATAPTVIGSLLTGAAGAVQVIAANANHGVVLRANTTFRGDHVLQWNSPAHVVASGAAAVRPFRAQAITNASMRGTVTFPAAGELVVEVFAFEGCGRGPASGGQGRRVGEFRFAAAAASSRLVDLALAVPAGRSGLATTVTFLPWATTSAMSPCAVVGADDGACTLCRCEGTAVDCTGAGLLFAPTLIPPNTTVLTLDNNQLFDRTSVEPLAAATLPHLAVLSMRNNALTVDVSASLGRLQALEELDLSRNPIAELDTLDTAALPRLARLNVSHGGVLARVRPNAFASSALRDVDLSFNALEASVLEAGGFGAATGLTGLDLRSNRITSVGPQVLQGAASLERLDLSSNRITSVDAEAFRGLTAIRLIDVGAQQDAAGEPLRIPPGRQLEGLPTLLAARWATDECPAGYGLVFSDGMSQFVCLRCRDGTHKAASGEGYAACAPCTAGSADEDRDPATRCTPCGAGTYAPAASVGACALLACLPGTVDLDGDAATPCVQCPAGSFAPAGSSGKCQACAAGTTDHDLDSATPCEACLFASAVPPNGAGPCTARSVRGSGEDSRLTIALACAWVGLVALIGAFFALRWYRGYRHRRRFSKTYHIFLSYRVRPDAKIARALCQKLQRMTVGWSDRLDIKVRCFFDAQDIEHAESFRDVCLSALKHSCVFVPLVSEAALEPLRTSTPDVTDTLLLEFEKALELADKQRVLVFPVLIGSRENRSGLLPEFNFERFGSHQFPDHTKQDSVSGDSVRTTLTKLLGYNGVKLASDAPGALSVYARGESADASATDECLQDLSLASIIHDVLVRQVWDAESSPFGGGRALWEMDRETGQPLSAINKGYMPNPVSDGELHVVLSANEMVTSL